MKRRHRLQGETAIGQLRREGRSWRHPLAILVARPNGLEVSRFAFSASRRVGKAVQRNRARRLLREAVRRQLARVEQGWDCLFIARPAATAAHYNDVAAAVAQLWRRAGLLRPETDRLAETTAAKAPASEN